ncbi:hypothetical protein BCR36DRAFT_316413 [Piromyces finnis]|uniref:Transmembrane protein 138 n=1 Tax=Piromyces finnis TaxID=1754191 RepID=A0A1Y1VNU7_9FUNG|nr:hypothetical protein BCR36DRAFT_316413 [Piromyces finnis]|eukprot:ORX60060.1 hypothetical protein BCR36DRAFT_316413 [Piromyces finnis]
MWRTRLNGPLYDNGRLLPTNRFKSDRAHFYMTSKKRNKSSITSLSKDFMKKNLTYPSLTALEVEQEWEKEGPAPPTSISRKLSTFRITLIIQSLLLILDVLFTLSVDFIRNIYIIVVIIYFCQFFCILWNVMMFTITLVSTNAFKAGYYNLLLNDFGYVFIITFLYFILFCISRGYSIAIFKECEESCDPYNILYGIIDITFRIVNIVYLFIYKHAVFKACQPQYFEYIWVNKNSVISDVSEHISQDYSPNEKK